MKSTFLLRFVVLALLGSLCLGTTYVMRENGKEVGRWSDNNGRDNTEYLENDIVRPKPPDPTKKVAPASQTSAQPTPSVPVSVASKATSDLTMLQAMKAVAFIRVKGFKRVLGEDEPVRDWSGSGTFINKTGTMLTNYHVVRGAETLTVIVYDEKYTGDTPQREYTARVLRIYPYHDLAVVNANVSSPNYFRFAEPDSIKVGDEVKAIGNPEGYQHSVSKGIVSAFRTNKLSGETIQSWKKYLNDDLKGETIAEKRFERITWIQTDAAINPGNSGGPLLNAKNELVGISTRGEGYWDAGLNFASHVKHAIEFAKAYQES